MINYKLCWAIEIFDNNFVQAVTKCVNLLATDFFFQILAHPVFKM